MWAPLPSFGQLEVLRLSLPWMQSQQSIHRIASDIEFIVGLRDLTLEISCCEKELKLGTDCFRSLTDLRSLRLIIVPFYEFRIAPFCLSHLTRLTSLALAGMSIDGSIEPLNELAYLSLRRLPQPFTDLDEELAQMTKLTELQFLDRDLRIPPNGVLSCLKNLRRLMLATEAKVDLGFCQSLASLPELTSLFFWSMSKQTETKDFRMQFVLLTQLQELRLRCGSDFDVLDLFGYGTFPRLRHLAIGSPTLADGEEQAMFNRFPCLRSYKSMQ